MTTTRAHRDTIFVESGTLLERHRFDAEQYVLRIEAPETARHAQAGTFVHVTCDSALPMRRPLSLMRVDAEAGWIEILFKTVGAGLAALATRKPGEQMSILGPIGQPFRPDIERPIALLVGGGVGIPPMIYLAEVLANDTQNAWQPLVFMGSEVPFPMSTRPSAMPVDGMPDDASHSLTLVESWGIPSRLASLANLTGAHQGYVTDLAAHWLAQQDQATRDRCELFACGPTPMLEAVARVASRFDVPCQVSLEEYMACAVGGCAGCTVLVTDPDGDQAMKRVCVDGPVFDSRAVFPDAT
ncbi:MAG: dihydroorotate dehydrogenase electron transfer subunit [Pseudomonadota bacterium]